MRQVRVLLAVVVLAVASGGPIAHADADLAPGLTVTATPTAGLADGQLVAITVKTTADQPVFSAEAQVCRAGVDFQTSTGIRPAADASVGGPNCPPNPISSSSDRTAVDASTYDNAPTQGGETFSLRVGTGVAAWTGPDGPTTLSCDAQNPCALVVELYAGQSPSWIPVVINLTYHDDDPISGCGGPAPGIVASAGSDRLADAWVAWTVAECGGHGAPTRATFDGEGSAAVGFGTGDVDLAYSALGLDAPGTFGAAPRDATAVPVALNAVVLAVGNGQEGHNKHKVPYTDIKLTQEEAAALVSGGPFGIDPYLDAIYAWNPELARTGFFDTSSAFLAGAAAESEATSYFATSFFASQQGDAWHVPDSSGVFGADAGKARGVDTSLALASPGYQNALTLLTGRPALQRNLVGLGGTDYGGVWVLTDLATADALGLTPVALDDGTGTFVEPDADSLNAAVPTLHRSANGALLPDPAAAAGTGAYPLTFVEYAIAPKEPLVDRDCVARTESQQLLSSWLDHLVGPGQGELPAGLEPLPGSLTAEASAAVATIGTAAVTGPCAGRVTFADHGGTPGAPTAAAPDGSAGTASDHLTGGVAAARDPASGAGRSITEDVAVAAAASTPSATRAAQEVVAQTHIAGAAGANALGSLVALVVLAGVASSAIGRVARSGGKGEGAS